MTLNLKTKTSRYHSIAQDTANLVVKKQAAYGDSFGQSGKIMQILYPAGIKIEQLTDALTVVRILDKLFRIATDRDALGENPWQDILGYSLLAVEKAKANPFQMPSKAPSKAVAASKTKKRIQPSPNMKKG